jgi:DNA polymerase elongation subunit (family B)
MKFSDNFDNLQKRCENLSSLTDDELIQLYKDAEIIRTEYDNLQLVAKCNCNSLYGVMAYSHFSMRDCDNAEDITQTGVHLTKLVDYKLNNYFETWADDDSIVTKINDSNVFPKIIKINNLQYVKNSTTDICVYGDTDSRYIDIEQIFNLLITFGNKPHVITDDNEQLTREILWFVDQIIMPVVERTIAEECEYRNVKGDRLFKMAHEIIARRSIFLKKKRYVMTVIWKDGKLFKEPKFKYTGVEIKRGAMSPLAKKLLKKLLDNLLIKGHDKDTLRKDLLNICNHIKTKKDKNYIYLVTSVTWDDTQLHFENGKYSSTKNHIQMQILVNWGNFINELKANNPEYGHLKLAFSGQKVNYYYTQNSPYKVIGLPDDIDFDDVPNLPEPDWNLMLFHVLIRPFLKYLSDTDIEITEKYAQNYMSGVRALF